MRCLKVLPASTQTFLSELAFCQKHLSTFASPQLTGCLVLSFLSLSLTAHSKLQLQLQQNQTTNILFTLKKHQCCASTLAIVQKPDCIST